MVVLVRKMFLDGAYVSPENFFDPPPVDNIFGKNLYYLVKILGNVGQNMTTPPPLTTLAFQAGDPCSILGRTSTQGLKIIEKKELPLHWHR
jgi:hypothetical protein